MTIPVTIPGGYVNILLGDEQSTEVFKLICGLNSQGFTHAVNNTDTFVPDCTDPTAVAVRVTNNTGEQWDLTGSGLATPQNIILVEGMLGVRKHLKFQTALPAGLTGYTPSSWLGYWVLGSYTITGTKGDGGLTTLTGMTFKSDGLVTFSAGTVPTP